MKNPKKMKADVVVIGTGPGGATVARDLTLKGKKVIMIERGKNVKMSGNAIASMEYIGGPLLPGFMFSKPDKLEMMRCLTVGGSTTMYTGTAFDPDIEKFKKFGVDIDPRIVDDIKRETKVAPLPDKYIGRAAKKTMAAARDLGYNWQKLNKFIDPSKGKVTASTVIYNGKSKWTAQDWTLEAVKKGAMLLPQTRCEKIIFENKQATGVQAVDKRGNFLEISGDVIILAAGGVGTPAVLKKSGILEAGQKFFFDPFAMTFGYISSATDYLKEPSMVSGFKTDDGIMITDMAVPYAVYAKYAAQAFQFSKVFRTRGLVAIMAKIMDDLEGSISINEKVTKRLTPQDQHLLSKGQVISYEILNHMGAKDIWFGNFNAAHPGGTARIGHIVDTNLESEYKNLYICDASVIPDQWGLPPVLTIMCLARRLSGYLMA